MTSSQFLRSLNQVSLTIRGTDELMSEYLPAAQAREWVQDELAKSGITVRANSPVALEVRLMHRPHDWKRTTTLFRNGIAIGKTEEKSQVHFQKLKRSDAWNWR